MGLVVPLVRPGPISCSQYSELLTFNLSWHHSWWHEHGPGCQREDLAASLRPSDGQALVPGVGCTLDPSYMEALHSALQILLAVSVGGGPLGVG